MRHSSKLFIYSLAAAIVAIAPQIYYEIFHKFSRDSAYDELGTAIKLTLFITVPFAFIAIGIFISALISRYSEKQGAKNSR